MQVLSELFGGVGEISGESTQLKQSVEDLVQMRLQIDWTQIATLCEQFEIIELGIFGSVLREDFRGRGETIQVMWIFW